jgi:hypothetical protein
MVKIVIITRSAGTNLLKGHLLVMVDVSFPKMSSTQPHIQHVQDLKLIIPATICGRWEAYC